MTITAAIVLVLVIAHPWGSSGLTSQSVDGFSSRSTCEEAAKEAVAQKRALSAFCVVRK
jgi:hypothetical protein